MLVRAVPGCRVTGILPFGGRAGRCLSPAWCPQGSISCDFGPMGFSLGSSLGSCCQQAVLRDELNAKGSLQISAPCASGPEVGDQISSWGRCVTLPGPCLFPQAQAQSCSEWDLRAGSHGSWPWKQRHSSGGLAPTPMLGRLQRPAVGSACDLASSAPLRLESSAVASAEVTCARSPSGLASTSEHSERGPPGDTCQQQPQPSAPRAPLGPPSNQREELPHPEGFPTAEGAKGDPAIPKLALPAPVQPLHGRPSTRRTRYCIAVTLQGREEEGDWPKPAQPAPHPCGPEESRGRREPPQGPRPITGYSTDTPQEPGQRAPQSPGSTAQRRELQTCQAPGSSYSG